MTDEEDELARLVDSTEDPEEDEEESDEEGINFDHEGTRPSLIDEEINPDLDPNLDPKDRDPVILAGDSPRYDNRKKRKRGRK